MKKIIKYFVLFAVAFLCVSSTIDVTFAADVNIKTYESGGFNGGEDELNPLRLETNYDEITIDYKNTGLPVYFTFSGGNTVMYNVTFEPEDKKIFFNVEEKRNSATFEAVPVASDASISYVQAGAQRGTFNSGEGSLPRYGILSKEVLYSWGGIFGGGKIYVETTLGNALKDTGTGTKVLDDSTYIFCPSGLPSSIAYNLGNQNGESIYATTTKGVGESPITLTINGPNTFLDTTNNETRVITASSPVYVFYGYSSEILNKEPASAIEQLITKVAVSMGDLFTLIIRGVFGNNVAIDAIVFDEYKPVKIDFFSPSSSSPYRGAFETVINNWFRNFTVFAEIILMVILVAMGIKAMLLSGTGNQQKINNMLVGWVLAVILLFFGPYFMKYVILSNESMVRILRGESKYSIYSLYNYDFLKNESGDFQIGEDSTTQKLLEQLNAALTEQTNNLEAAKRELERLENIRQGFLSNLSNLMQSLINMKYYLGDPNTGGVFLGRGVIAATRKMDTIVEQNPANYTQATNFELYRVNRILRCNRKRNNN